MSWASWIALGIALCLAGARARGPARAAWERGWQWYSQRKIERHGWSPSRKERELSLADRILRGPEKKAPTHIVYPGQAGKGRPEDDAEDLFEEILK